MKTEMYSELERKIEDQRRGKEGTAAWMIGQQLLDMAARDERVAELLCHDLDVAEMSLEKAADKLQKYADGNRGKAKCFCITPDVAEKILRKFYGLPKGGAAAGSVEASGAASVHETGESGSDFIDLTAFL